MKKPTLEEVEDAIAHRKVRTISELSEMVNAPYQLCPKCSGQGRVSKPPYVPGDIHQWSGTSTSFICDVCGGSKVIPVFQVNQSTPITREALIERGFEDLSDPFNEAYKLRGSPTWLTVENREGEYVVSVCQKNENEKLQWVYVDCKNCKTMEQIDQLILMFIEG